MSAQWLYIAANPKAVLVRLGLIIGIIVLVAILLSREVMELMPFFLAALVFAFLLIIFYWPYRWKMYYRRQKALQASFTWEFDGDSIQTNSPLAQGTVQWEVFSRWKEGNGLFLLFQTERMMNILPKHGFASDEDVDAFRELLKEKIGPKR